MHPTRIFKTPEELEAAWEHYKAYRLTESTKWPKVQYVGKDGIRVEDYPVLPLTMDGFEVFCYKEYGTVDHYFTNKEGYYTEFGTICSHIKKQIKDHQITGGMLGQFNPSITQRLNGLADQQKTEVTVNSVNANFGNTIQSPPKSEDNTRLD